MAKNNNVIEEIQELIQQIKTEYEEGVDFKIPYYSEKHETGAIIHLSPRLKSFLRKKFDFPSGVNDYLDYSKTNSANNYYYRLDGEHGKGEHEGLYWRLTNRGLEQEQPQKCKSCGEMTFEENGRMLLWNEKTIGKEFGQESKVIGYFHPECAKKHFVDKEQPRENNTRIKEKLLRNLDKISLDPIGYLANAEIAKGDIEKDYYKGNANSEAIDTKIHKVEIEGEEIDLVKLEAEVKRAIRKAIIQEIKQSSPQDWKIVNSNIYDIPSQNIPDSFKVLRHKSGRRHWNVGIIYYNESLEKGKKDWTEIEALINGSPLPVENQNQTSDWKEGWIEKYFRDNGIYLINLDGDNLVIKYNDKNKKEEIIETKKPELQLIKEIVAQQKDHSLTFSKSPQSTDLSQPSPNKNNHHLVIGLTVGAGAVILVGILVYFIHQRKK